MIWYIGLTITCILIALFSYRIFNRDILSPSLISSLIFLFSTICAIFGLSSWNNISLSFDCFMLLFIGLFSFLIGETIARRVFYRKKIEKDITQSIPKETWQQNKISTITLVLLATFAIITTFFLIKEIGDVCAFYGFQGENIMEKLAFYRTKTSLFSDTTSIRDINFIVKQCWKICSAIGIILFTYFTILKNSNEKIGRKRTLLIFSIITITLLQSFLYNGGRSILFHYVISFIGITLFYRLTKKQKTLSKKNLQKILVLTSALLLIFYLLLPIVGRKTNHGFMEYTSFYLGASIPSLQLYLEESIESSDPIGEESFSGVYYTLNKLHIIDYTKAQTHEWRAFADNGTLSSNVYTSIRSYYKDFGIFGVIILQLLFGFIITIFYLKTKHSSNILSSIIYFNYLYILFDQVRDEQFYSLISISSIAQILIIIITFYIINIVNKICVRKK